MPKIINDQPLVATVHANIKVPTGEAGDTTLSVGQISSYVVEQIPDTSEGISNINQQISILTDNDVTQQEALNTLSQNTTAAVNTTNAYVNTLDNRLTSEVDNRTQADALLAQSVIVERDARIAADTVNANAISNEVIARTQGDSDNLATIGVVADSVVAEANARTQADNALQADINKRVRFDVNNQGLSGVQQTNARTNIDAEKSGTAAALIATITPESIGAADSTAFNQVSTDLSALQTSIVTKASITYVNDIKADQLTKDQAQDAAISAVGGGSKSYLTLASLNAVTPAPAVNTLAYVSNDSTAANNGMYTYDGSEWVKSLYDPLTQAKAYSDANALFKPLVLAAAADFNTLTAEGRTVVPTNVIAAACTNRPSSAAGILDVALIGSGVLQTYRVFEQDLAYERQKLSGGTWTDWIQLASKDMVDTSAANTLQGAKDYADEKPSVKAKVLTDADDLNNILVEGNYLAFSGVTPTLLKNYPVTRLGHLRMDWVATGSTGTVGFQWYQSDLGGIYWRNTLTNGSAWLPWQQILKKSDLDSASTMVKVAASGTDLNTLVVRGQYQIVNVNAATYLNLPPQMLEQEGVLGGGVLTVIKSPETYITVQYYDGYAEFGSYFRSMLGNGGWTAWQQIGRKLTKFNYKDLNTLLTVGVHICTTNAGDATAHHYPIFDQLIIEVMAFANVYRQVAYQRSNNVIWTRSHWGPNGWQAWDKLTTAADLNAAITALPFPKYDNLLYAQTIDSLLRDPLKSVRIKLIGDSITWGMGSSAVTPTDPRTGYLTDPRNSTVFTSKTWANLLRQWIAKVYGDAAIVEDRAGSAYTTKALIAQWRDIYKSVKMTNLAGTVLTDAQKLAVIDTNTAFESGTSVNLLGANFPLGLRPQEMEFDIVGDNLTIMYQKQKAGDANDIVEMYVDNTLVDTFNYYAEASDYTSSKTINFAYGKHKIKLINIATNANSYVRLGGFKTSKKTWVINEGIIGITTAALLSRNILESTLDGLDDVIIFMLGTNDRAGAGGVEGYKKQLNDSLDRIITLSPNSKVILMSSTFAASEAPTAPYKFDMGVVDKVNAAVARERNLIFISQYKGCALALIDGESIWSDGLHLNDAGNKLYFKNIIKQIFAV